VISSTSIKASLTSASSSSATPTPTQRPLVYNIATNWGTSVDVCNRFVQELDGGKGKVEIIENRQYYKTTLNTTQANGLRTRYPFLVMVYTDLYDYKPEDFEGDDLESFHAIPKSRNAKQELLGRD
jgi:hypothetical protein